LKKYCDRSGDYFDVAKSMIEDRLGRRLICECQILNDERAIRRKELERMFGVDFGTRVKGSWIWCEAGLYSSLLFVE
jgi:hypothetical protein